VSSTAETTVVGAPDRQAGQRPSAGSRNSLAIRVGGRAAELLVVGEASTGAADDLAGATQLAVRMVREYGLSADLGPVAYPMRSGTYLDVTATDRPFAEGTQRRVDKEVAWTVGAGSAGERSASGCRRPARSGCWAGVLTGTSVGSGR
jgi:ATP-dependent Zn protease